ncbi:DUF6233 domain-containing protein [Streptomyces incanus]|uniref:DUF6233 domain-containing protein n=1 Tax=Streptomyces incanus TaxID=887453 RepID=A0ABW0XXM0_9ACTN
MPTGYTRLSRASVPTRTGAPHQTDEARRLLADGAGAGACTHCRPDAGLGILGLWCVS